MNSTEIFEEADEDIKDRLLQLIEEGDPTIILSSQYLESLNELIKNELISIENDRLKLTEKGLKAKIMGYKTLMKQTLAGEEQREVKIIPQKKISTGISNHSFLIILFFFLISILAILSLTNS